MGRLGKRFIKKSEKTKFGGNGQGGVYRDIVTGKDYFFKRPQVSSSDPAPQVLVNARVWDEILAANILKKAGVFVPNTFAVADQDGWVYVASEKLHAVQTDTKAHNIDSTNDFFALFLADPETECRSHLLGAKKIAQFTDKDIEELVNATGHTLENKKLRIDVLKRRRDAILSYIESKYASPGVTPPMPPANPPQATLSKREELTQLEHKIQAALTLLGIHHTLVHISKKPDSLGEVSLKPEINSQEGNTQLDIEPNCWILISELFPNQCSLEMKESQQGRTDVEDNVITRQCIDIDKGVKADAFYQKLQTQIDAIENPEESFKRILISKIDDYLQWRNNKNKDDGRGYPVGFFTSVRHGTAFGINRACQLRYNLDKASSLYEVISTLQTHLTKDSRVHNHSLDTYLLEGVSTTVVLSLEDHNLRTVTGRKALRQQILNINVNTDFLIYSPDPGTGAHC